MENFYNLLQINNNSSKEDIISAYKKSIKKFNNIAKLSIPEINEIKALKTGLYILTNNQLRYTYDNIITTNIDNTNEYENNELDNVFNIDNSWMNSIDQNKNLKRKSDINIIGNRIFSLSELNKRPDVSDADVLLRTPQQGRIDKNLQEL